MSGDKLHKQHCLELLVDRLLECLLETQFNEQLVVDFHGSFASCCEILRLIVSRMQPRASIGSLVLSDEKTKCNDLVVIPSEYVAHGRTGIKFRLNASIFNELLSHSLAQIH